jgi:hypothetical protein
LQSFFQPDWDLQRLHRIESALRIRCQLFERTAERDEGLAQQTATAEVLGVINSSSGELAPVFDAMLDKALALWDAAFGLIWRYESGSLHAAAVRGATPEYADFLTQDAYRPDPGSANARLVAGSNVEHLADVADSDDYRSGNPLPRALVDLGGGHSLLAVALRRERTYLGNIVIYRREVRPFTDKQIALLQNFAAQAAPAAARSASSCSRTALWCKPAYAASNSPCPRPSPIRPTTAPPTPLSPRTATEWGKGGERLTKNPILQFPPATLAIRVRP